MRLYFQTQDGFGGRGILPEAGGLMDQLAILMEAFDVVAAWEADHRPTPENPGGDDGN